MISALLQGSLATIQGALNDSAGRVSGIQPSGRPPRQAGQWYYSLWYPGSITNNDDNSLSIDRSYPLNVTVTGRFAYAPRDRQGGQIVAAASLLQQAELIADALHMDYAGMNAANLLIPGFDTATNGFVEPLKLASIGPVVEEDGDWVGSDGERDVLTVLVAFTGARRIRLIGS